MTTWKSGSKIASNEDGGSDGSRERKRLEAKSRLEMRRRPDEPKDEPPAAAAPMHHREGGNEP